MGLIRMVSGFSRTLSLLRKEKGVNQRAVASELGISQALLSHYETGAREPGLEFLSRVCDYYGVTVDYMLGRTLVRGSSKSHDDIEDASEEKDNRLEGRAASSLLAKKLITGSISILYDIAGRSGHNGLVSEMTNYFGSTVYKLFRLFYKVAGSNPETFFSEPATTFPALSNADISIAEANVQFILTSKSDRAKLIPLSNDTLSREFPKYSQALLTVIHQAGERATKRI